MPWLITAACFAYLYVRQSSLQQVHDHRESTARQYDLKRRAHALGWPLDCQPTSMWQVALQPSPVAVPPSSQNSPGRIRPSPQIVVQTLGSPTQA